MKSTLNLAHPAVPLSTLRVPLEYSLEYPILEYLAGNHSPPHSSSSTYDRAALR